MFTYIQTINDWRKANLPFMLWLGSFVVIMNFKACANIQWPQWTKESSVAVCTDPGKCTIKEEIFMGAPFWAPIELNRGVDLNQRPTKIFGQENSAEEKFEEVPLHHVGLSEAIAGGGIQGVGISFVDINHDGWPDLFIANGKKGKKYIPSKLFLNQKNGSFLDVTVEAKIDKLLHKKDIYSIAATDFDNDGDLDFYFGAHPKNILLENKGGAVFEDSTDKVKVAGPEIKGFTNDMKKLVRFVDYDKDGFLDILCHLSTTQGEVQNAFMLRNQGDGTFVESKDDPGLKLDSLENPISTEWKEAKQQLQAKSEKYGETRAYGDFNGDGLMDYVVARSDGSPIVLHKNITPVGEESWIKVKVRKTPRTGEFGGIGARVAVKTGDKIQFKDIKGGSELGSQDDLSVNFRLGNWSGVEWVAVLWPDGRQKVVLNVPGNQALSID